MGKISKLLFFCSIILSSYCSTLFAIQVYEITDKFLQENASTDYVQHFEKLFQEASIDSFLEFGIGYGTKYFLDRCGKVTSCEIILPEQTDSRFQHTRDLLKEYNNWTPILIQGSQNLHNANLLNVVNHIDPALYDASYVLELKEICEKIFKDHSFEVAFIDPVFHMRGDLVNELFDRVPIIAAHDTNISPETYGWYKINTPSNYEKIVFSQGQGVTFWVRNDKADLIAALKGYLGVQYQVPQRKNLRIFFPQMHPVLVQSMALTLQHLGHTLVLPGESFDPNSPHGGLKINYGTFFKKNPLDSVSFTSFFSDSPDDCSFLKQNVEVIENDELLTHPPDVLFVNCLEVEKSVYMILLHFKRNYQNPPKLAHYSGNNRSRYNPRYVKNLIAVDAFTASYYDPTKTNIIFWIPWIDFEHLKFEGVTDSLVMNSYLSHQNLKKSAALFNDISNKVKLDFPEIEINSYPKPMGFPYVRHNNFASLINDSCATIHIKETEGFGYTIIESLAKGRPVFLKRSFSLGSRLMNWCIEGRTAFFFDDYLELKNKLSKYLDDRDFRHQVQSNCADVVRQIIDNEKQARILDRFLQNLD